MSDDIKKVSFDAEVVAEEGDGEEVTEVSQQEVNGDFDAESFGATKALIQRLSVKLDELKNQQKEYRQRLKNVQDNDAALAEFEQEAKNAAEAFRKRKKDLMESVEAREARAKAKEVSEEIKDIEESLTNHLLAYYQITGTQSFETPAGEEREFKLNARLLPAKSA